MRDQRGCHRIPTGVHVPRPAQQRLAAGGQLVGGHRHRDDIVGAGTKRTDAHRVGIGGRDADDVRIREPAHGVEQGAALGAGELEVDHDHVGRERLGEHQRGRLLGRRADGETPFSQRHCSSATKQGVVHCEQHSWCKLCVRFHQNLRLVLVGELPRTSIPYKGVSAGNAPAEGPL